METLLEIPVQLAQPHALPFRVIFEEQRRRREAELLKHAGKVLGAATPAAAAAALLEHIAAQEKAYAELAEVNAEIAAGKLQMGSDDNVKACLAADDALTKILHLMNSSALCLSGGGIRSASYSLGVLEGMSRLSRPGGPAPTQNLMDELDYVSSVSGGGYICSWLMSWVVRRNHAKKMAGQPEDWKGAYREVISALAGENPAGGGHTPVTGGDPEPQPVRHLRSYTSYLAPDVGLTLDTFTLAAIVLRNLFVNWVMLVPGMFALIAAAEYSGFQFVAASYRLSQDWGLGLGLTIAGIFLLGSLAAAVALPSHSKVAMPRQPVLAWIAGKIRKRAIGIFLFCFVMAPWLLLASSNPFHLQSRRFAGQTFLEIWLIALLGYGVVGGSIFLAHSERISRVRSPAGSVSRMRISRWHGKTLSGLMVAIATVVCSSIMAGILVLLQTKVYKLLLEGGGQSGFLAQWALGDRLFIVFALPLLISCLLMVTSLFCALLGIYEMEEDREWWVRTGGCLLMFNLAWVFAHGIAFYGQGGWHRVIAGCVGLALGAAGSAAGFSGVTSAGPQPVKAAQLGTAGKFLQQHSLILPVVSACSLALIALGTVEAEEAVRKAILAWLGTPAGWWPAALNMASAAILFGISAGLSVLINLAININLFSLHGMYRMRLMRAFLGASNVFRHPNPFTNFDPRDTPHEVDLPCAPRVPLHLINTTLNLVGTRDTAWKQRKAESFTFSPVHAGSWRLGYVPAEIYGGIRGVTLATAMSISGAAFNPNMGYQSSPLLSLIMTFFNVRLGCWLPNPKRRIAPDPDGSLALKNEYFLHRSGPSFALKPLIAEALGMTNDTSRWIELTDGGHFENLGLYEMVMRRCKRIVVVDAGADPEFQFEDLGNAIRKIFIDLGVPIRFPDEMKMKAGMQTANSYCAVAKIDYGCVDSAPPGLKPSDLEGYLVYLKAGLTGQEPVDILQYAMTHKTFPHETTANQFFNEAQFESYRHLGSFVVECVGKNAPALSHGSAIDNFISAGYATWAAAGMEK